MFDTSLKIAISFRPKKIKMLSRNQIIGICSVVTVVILIIIGTSMRGNDKVESKEIEISLFPSFIEIGSFGKKNCHCNIQESKFLF